MKDNQAITELSVETGVKMVNKKAFQFTGLPTLAGEDFSRYCWRSLAAFKVELKQRSPANPVLSSFHPAHLSEGRYQRFCWAIKKPGDPKLILRVGSITECDFDHPVNDHGWVFIPFGWAVEVLGLIQNGIRGFCAQDLITMVDGNVGRIVGRPSFRTFRMGHSNRPSPRAQTVTVQRPALCGGLN